MTTTQELLPSGVADVRDVPLDADASMGDAEYAHLMHRLGVAEGEPGTSVSAFNSSI